MQIEDMIPTRQGPRPRRFRSAPARRLVLLLLGLILSGPASVLAQTTDDPFEPVNRGVYHFNKAFDTVLMKPLARSYDRYLPGYAKTGVRNFFNNLDDVNVVFNDILQLKMQQAMHDSGRLLLNSTIGIGGLLDIGTEVGLHKHEEDFGQTLGRWGLGHGGYLMLPILGSSTVRDTIGLIPDIALNPLRLVTDNKVQASLVTLDLVDTRVRYFPAERMIRGDEYDFVRNAYLQRREYLVQDGQVYDEFDDF